MNTLLRIGILLAAWATLALPVPVLRALPPTQLATAAGQRTEATTAQGWFEKGQRALASADLTTAEECFRHVLALDPKSGAAYANLGVIAMRRRNWDEALQDLKKAETLAPKMSGIRLNIGLVEFRRENYEAAIGPLQTVVREQPDSLQARYLLGLCQMFTAKFPQAVETLAPLWDRLSDEVMYLYVLGIVANKSGDKELDQKALQQLLRVGGDSPELHLILGKAYYMHQEYDPALVELQKALEANRELPFLHFTLGMTYKQLGQDSLSEKEFLTDLNIDPDLPDNYYQLGLLYSREQRDADAEKAFGEALKLDRRRSGAWFGLAKIYEKGEDYTAALQAVDESLRLVPNSLSVHFLRGQILQHLGRIDEAKAEFVMAKRLMNKGLEEDREKMERWMMPDPELRQPPH